MSERYSIYRPGSANRFGDFGVIDERLGYQQPVAICKDGEMAQKIADLLNAEPHMEELVSEIENLNAQLESQARDIHDSYAS